MPPVKKTLDHRGTQYGEYKTQAELARLLKMCMTESLYPLSPFQSEALDMIQHKIARILNGNPNFIDNWRDIAGYAQLVVDILSSTPGATDVKVEYVTVPEKKWPKRQRGKR